MKVNILDAHDRYEYLIKQPHAKSIGECCQDLINQKPFGNYPFYIFAHMRTDDDGVRKRLIWQPRLTKPKAQTNSMLFRAYPNSDIVKVLWMIPDRNLWPEYTKGKLAQNKTVAESIHDFQNDRQKLEGKEEDDLQEEKINEIYKEISQSARKKSRLE
jgi:hypothetical protein